MRNNRKEYFEGRGVMVFAPLLMIVFTCCTSSMAIAQMKFTFKRNVPVAVKDSFTKRFPHTKAMYWKRSHDSVYRVAFKPHRVAVFLKNGAWSETRSTFSGSSIPRIIRDTLLQRGFGSWEAGKVTKREVNNDTCEYIVVVQSTNEYYEHYHRIRKRKELHFDPAGRLVRAFDLAPIDEDWPIEHF